MKSKPSKKVTEKALAKSIPKGLLSLLDDEPTPNAFPAVVAATVGAKKKGLAALMADDEPMPQTEPAKPATVAKKAPPPPTEPSLVPALTAPPEFFNVQTRGGVRFTIIDRLGSDFKDVLGYNWEMKVTMHVKIEDLYPLDTVRTAIDFIRSQLRSEK